MGRLSLICSLFLASPRPIFVCKSGQSVPSDPPLRQLPSDEVGGRGGGQLNRPTMTRRLVASMAWKAVRLMHERAAEP
jgi:hypothetical protein